MPCLHVAGIGELTADDRFDDANTLFHFTETCRSRIGAPLPTPKAEDIKPYLEQARHASHASPIQHNITDTEITKAMALLIQ
jgi:hypothetical protein